MKKISYPQYGTKAYVALLNDYKNLFRPDLSKLETQWSDWKQEHSINNIPESVEDLLVTDTQKMADVYSRFVTLGLSESVKSTTGRNRRSSDYCSLDAIFHYSHGYDKHIADFFINNAEILHISACHYCELSYINVYNSTEKRRQFDLDHFFPKSRCPILALSLFNLIPSCQVCNSRIKLNSLLGDNMSEWGKFNPASNHYDFDANVSIRLRMKKPVTNFENRDDYYIHFRCRDTDYRKPIKFFHLEERYDFHRIEAMRLMSLKAKYPKSVVKMISSLLQKPEANITEDIFHRKYLTEKDRCLAKLTRDILS